MHQQHQIDYRRVERGITYIAAHFREGPALEDVVAAAHVSPFHFQPMFTAWVGVSLKIFARYLSLDHARHALRNGGVSLLGRLDRPAGRITRRGWGRRCQSGGGAHPLPPGDPRQRLSRRLCLGRGTQAGADRARGRVA